MVFRNVPLSYSKDLRHGWQTWTKDKKRPAWISAEQYALLPSTMKVRLVRYVVARGADKGTYLLS